MEHQVESRPIRYCILTISRCIHAVTIECCAGLFRVSYIVARTAFNDLTIYENMMVCLNSKTIIKSNSVQNPVGSMPTIWNEHSATDSMKSALLWDIRNSQSPRVQRMVSALRSPQGGLPV